MAQDITLLGASYAGVPAVELPKTGGGTARFDDTSDADAAAEDIASGKTAYVNGAKITGTGSGGGGGGTEDEAAIIMRTISGAYENSRVTEVGSYAFNWCSNLTAVSFPAATSIHGYAFANCFKLTTVSFPSVTTIGSYAFTTCSSLTAVFFPVATSLGSYAFNHCSRLTTASFPSASNVGSYAFSNCYSLTDVSFPAAKTVFSYAFLSCSYLATISLPALTGIRSSAFYRCFRLVSLYLMGSSVASLSNSNAFNSTPIAGYSASAGQVGSIYVPASLLSAYKAATNWAYFSSRFVGV